MGVFEQVKESAPLEEYAKDMLQKVKGSYVCPACGSGSGRNKTPALQLYSDHWHCHKCQAHGDVFDLAAYVEKLDPEDRTAHLKVVADWARVPLDLKPMQTATTKERPKMEERKPSDYEGARNLEAQRIKGWKALYKNSPASEYVAKRGFTPEEAKRFGFGYDERRRRLVIPWKGNEYYHIDRALDHDGDGKYIKPRSSEVGRQPLYNPEALNLPVFYVVEGALDALAVEAVGFEAVALGGTGYKDLIAALNTRRYRGSVIVFLDSDDAGREKAEGLYKELMAAGIAAQIATLDGFPAKDPADMLKSKESREAMRAILRAHYDEAVQKADEAKNEAYKASLARLRVMDASTVTEDIYTLTDEPETIPTGIWKLDDVLDGGLTRGVYVLGAVSSLGKTTLYTQIASDIAASGRSVLFATIEQSGHEIIAKVLSRMMAQRGFTASTTEITRARWRNHWSDEKNTAFLEVCERFASDMAQRFHLIEGVSQPTTTDIATVAQTIADHDGIAPVVFIDYLQLLKPENDRDTDKQAVDRNMTALRQLAARDLKTPVCCVSSLNRSSYSGIVTLDAYKESGAIEYGADVLLGLQPRGMAEELDNADDKKVKRKADKLTRESKDKLERECEITILKNRTGRTPIEGIPLVFDVLGSRFIEG